MDERTLGSLGISIPTSMALESLCGLGEFVAPNPPALENDNLLINIRTLCRNAFTSYANENHQSVDSNKIIEDIEYDIEVILDTVAKTAPLMSVVIYVCTYEGLNTKYKHANFKNSNTANQQFYEAIERDVIKHFIETDTIIQFKLVPTGKQRCVIMTHLPLDLLAYVDMDRLLLLESHTGKLKGRKEWHTKLNVKKDGPVIPFTNATIQIFGDGRMFAPQPLPMRRLMLAISDKRKWHAMTTHSKMLEDLKMANEPFAVQFLMKYR